MISLETRKTSILFLVTLGGPDSLEVPKRYQKGFLRFSRFFDWNRFEMVQNVFLNENSDFEIFLKLNLCLRLRRCELK